MFWILLTSCYRNTVYLGPPAGSQVHEEEATFFWWGAGGEHTVDLDQVCPQGVSSIAEEQDFDDGLVACCTLGFVARVTIRVTCADGSAYRVIDDEALGGSWVVEES